MEQRRIDHGNKHILNKWSWMTTHNKKSHQSCKSTIRPWQRGYAFQSVIHPDSTNISIHMGLPSTKWFRIKAVRFPGDKSLVALSTNTGQPSMNKTKNVSVLLPRLNIYDPPCSFSQYPRHSYESLQQIPPKWCA